MAHHDHLPEAPPNYTHAAQALRLHAGPLLAMFVCRLALELWGAVIRLPGESYRLRVRNQTKEPQPRRPVSKLLGLMLLVPLCSSVRHPCADRTYAR